MQITGHQKTSFIDYPGTVSTVLFLSGCGLRCPYCHNPGVVRGEYDIIPFDVVKEYIVKRKGVIEGAVITGGEPSLHGGLREMCDELRSLGLKIKIDTNGLEPDRVIACAPDYVALDIKTSLENYSRVNIRNRNILPNDYDLSDDILPNNYDLSDNILSNNYGLSNNIPPNNYDLPNNIPPNYYDYHKRLRKSIDFVKSMGDNAEVRITAAPGIVDTGDIEKLTVQLKGVRKVFIQQFEPAKEMLDMSFTRVKPYQPYVLDNWRKMFLDAGVRCEVRGV